MGTLLIFVCFSCLVHTQISLAETIQQKSTLLPVNTNQNLASRTLVLQEDEPNSNYTEADSLIASNDKTNLQNGTKISGSDPKSFYYQLALYKRNNSSESFDFKCGAAIISRDWAITAAQCISGVLAKDIKLVAGKYNLVVREKSPVVIGVSKVVHHENYTGSPYKYNDIALMKFNKSLHFSVSINAVLLADKERKTTGPVIISGWGTQGQDENQLMTQDHNQTIINNNQTLAQNSNQTLVKITNQTEAYTRKNNSLTILKKSMVVIQKFDQCKKLRDSLRETQLCATPYNRGTDSCQGDIGGPVVQKSRSGKSLVLVGIVSFQRKCATSEFTGIYTSVSKYRTWIDMVMKK